MPNQISSEQTAEIVALREKRLTTKQIARKLGLKVSDVNGIVRAQASQVGKTRSSLPPVYECFMDRNGAKCLLGLEPDIDDILGEWNEDFWGDERGLAGILVSRKLSNGRLEVVNFLVDSWCLGVKDAVPPRKFNLVDYRYFVRQAFGSFGGEYVKISFKQAQSVVFGAVDYAKSLGIDPHEDYQKAKRLLGDRPSSLSQNITFGREGKPFYFAGPYDDAQKIMNILNRTVGEENFEYVLPSRKQIMSLPGFSIVSD